MNTGRVSFRSRCSINGQHHHECAGEKCRRGQPTHRGAERRSSGQQEWPRPGRHGRVQRWQVGPHTLDLGGVSAGSCCGSVRSLRRQEPPLAETAPHTLAR